MKLAIQQENLKKALAQVNRAVPGKPPFPILGNVLLATDQGQGLLRLSTTDLSIAITVWCPAQIEQDGKVLVPASLFADLIAGLPNDRVMLDVNHEHQIITVSCARFSTQINGADAAEFPAIPLDSPLSPSVDPSVDLASTNDLPRVSFTAATLRAAIHQVACAAADTDARPVLAGISVRLHESTATLAAADGFRLALKQIALPAPVPSKHEVIIPAPALRELAGLLSDTSESISMRLVTAGTGGTNTATQAIFATANVSLATRLIDGHYPDVERILPKSCSTRAILDVRELNRAVKLAKLFANAGASQNVVKLSVSAGAAVPNGTVTLSANANGIGANTGLVDSQVSGEGGQIAFNVHYLSEALAAIDTPQVAFEMVTAQAPGVLRPVGQNGYVHVIMPMSLR